VPKRNLFCRFALLMKYLTDSCRIFGRAPRIGAFSVTTEPMHSAFFFLE
jgi:hypothetical protein